MEKTSKKKKQNQVLVVLHRLKRNKMAMVGLFVITLMVLASVFAPWIAPYGYEQQDLYNIFKAPGGAHI